MQYRKECRVFQEFRESTEFPFQESLLHWTLDTLDTGRETRTVQGYIELFRGVYRGGLEPPPLDKKNYGFQEAD